MSVSSYPWSHDLVKSLPESSTGLLAILLLLCRQARKNLQEELMKKNKQNLDDRPSAAGCTYNVIIGFRYDMIIKSSFEMTFH